MPIPEPFTPIALTAGILTNIAADILEHHAQALEGTLVGRMLKWAGLIEPNFNDRLRDTLSKALSLYFEAHPQYKLTGIMAFFHDPEIARQIGAYILDRKPINQVEVQHALDRHLGSDAVTKVLIQQRELDLEHIIPNFLKCYRRVLNEQLSVPQIAILLEIVDQTDMVIAEMRASEQRLKDHTDNLAAVIRRAQEEVATFKGLPNSIGDLLRACQLQAENEIRGAVGNKYVPTLYVDRLAREQIESFISKHPTAALRHVRAALIAVDREAEAIRARQAEIKQRAFSTAYGKPRRLTPYEKSLLDRLDTNLDAVSSLRPLLEELESLMEIDRPVMREVRAILEQVDTHPGCLSAIRANIDRVKLNLRNCLVIKDAAGRGKTNLACALASKRVKYQPTVLVAAGTLRLEDKFGLERYIQVSLGYSRSTPVRVFMDRLASLAGSADTDILIVIDAINENRDTNLLKSAIQSFVSRYNDQHFRFIVMCRDIYWEGFFYTKGDFWDEYIFAQIQLGDFTPEEFAKALPLYFQQFKIRANLSPEAANKLRHPLLLRFFCEAYRVPGRTVNLGQIEDVRLKKLFDTYWTKKVESVRGKLTHRDPKAVQEFLLLIGRKMRFNRDRMLSFDDITKMTGLVDFETPDSIYTQILDEGIILEQTPSGLGAWHQPRVTFVYDEFMEYVMARDLMLNTMNTDDRRKLELRLKRSLKSARRFSSVYEVIAYLLLMLEEERSFNAWDIVYSRGEMWYLPLCKALSSVLPHKLSPNALAVANKLAQSGNATVRWEITRLAQDLERVRPGKAIPLWCILLQDPLADIRLVARDALVTFGQADYAAATEGLTRALQHPDPNVRGTAVYTLAELGNLHTSKLLPLLQDKDGYVREATLNALGRLGTSVQKETEEAIMAGLTDRIAEVRAMAAKAIGETGDDCLVPALLNAKAHEDVAFVREVMDEVLEYELEHEGRT